jgi:hypothetical protein
LMVVMNYDIVSFSLIVNCVSMWLANKMKWNEMKWKVSRYTTYIWK